MKNDEINLSAPATSEKKVEKLIVTPSFWIFAAIFLIASVLMIYSLFLKSKSSGLETLIGNIQKQISEVNTKKQKLLVTTERLSAVKGILSSRSKLDEAVFYILSEIPQSFKIDTITANDKVISMTLISSSLQDFADFMEEKVPSLVKENTYGIKLVEAASFEQNTMGYTLNVNFNLKEPAK